MIRPKYIDGTLIVNKTYPLPADFDPGDLTDETKAALGAMCECAGREGLSYKIISGYRSYKAQETTYAYYLGLLGREKADVCSARPGFSEHQTGLAVDLNDNTEALGDTPEGRWLAGHAHDFGFVIRFPRGKEDITGYIYEPWHLRFLGRELATKVHESGLCLEEYFGVDSRYAD